MATNYAAITTAQEQIDAEARTPYALMPNGASIRPDPANPSPLEAAQMIVEAFRPLPVATVAAHRAAYRFALQHAAVVAQAYIVADGTGEKLMRQYLSALARIDQLESRSAAVTRNAAIEQAAAAGHVSMLRDRIAELETTLRSFGLSEVPICPAEAFGPCMEGCPDVAHCCQMPPLSPALPDAK